MTRSAMCVAAAALACFTLCGCGSDRGSGGGGGLDPATAALVLGTSGVTGTCEGSSRQNDLRLEIDGHASLDNVNVLLSEVVDPGPHEVVLDNNRAFCNDEVDRRMLDVAAGDRYLFVVRGTGGGGEIVTVENLAGRYVPTQEHLILVHASTLVGPASWTTVGPGGSPSASGNIGPDEIQIIDVAPVGPTMLTVTDITSADVFMTTDEYTYADTQLGIRLCVLRDSDDETSTSITCSEIGHHG